MCAVCKMGLVHQEVCYQFSAMKSWISDFILTGICETQWEIQQI